jgi:hypothetical protein
MLFIIEGEATLVNEKERSCPLKPVELAGPADPADPIDLADPADLEK